MSGLAQSGFLFSSLKTRHGVLNEIKNMSVRSAISLAKKIVSEAEKEIAKEKEENLKVQAKSLLKDIQEAKKTVSLLERQLNNFMREVDLN
jgi:uncharacterized membrane protein YcjF (UPF0283 family)